MPEPARELSAPSPTSREDDLVRAFVAGRDADDAAARRRSVEAWHELLARERDRVHALVAAFRVPDHPDVRVPRDDVEEVAHAAIERCLVKLLEGFRGTSIGELRAAVRTATRYTCLDSCRARMREYQRRAGSLDERTPLPSGDEAGRFDRDLAELGRRLEEDRSDAALELGALRDSIDALDNEDQRQVLELTGQGFSSKEIAGKLGLTVANVDQLRFRALRRIGEELDRDG